MGSYLVPRIGPCRCASLDPFVRAHVRSMPAISSPNFRVDPLLPGAFPCFSVASRCFPLLPVASRCFPLLPLASRCFPLLPVASRCFPWLPVASRCFPWLPKSKSLQKWPAFRMPASVLVASRGFPYYTISYIILILILILILI